MTFHDGRRLERARRALFVRAAAAVAAREPVALRVDTRRQGLVAGESRSDLAGFRIHSATEFSIELEEPVALLPGAAGAPGRAIVPEGGDPAGCPRLGRHRARFAWPPSSRAGAWSSSETATYWRQGYPRSEGLVFTFGVPPEEILAGFRGGPLLARVGSVPVRRRGAAPRAEFASGYRETPRLVTYYVAFNSAAGCWRTGRCAGDCARPWTCRGVVRQTIGRLAIPAARPDPARAPRPRVPRARGRAGAPRPRPRRPAAIELTAAVHPVFFGQYAAFARELASAFAEQGVTLRIVNTTMAEYLDATTRARWTSPWGGGAADYPDADTFVYILHSRDGFLGPARAARPRSTGSWSGGAASRRPPCATRSTASSRRRSRARRSCCRCSTSRPIASRGRSSRG